MILSSMILSLVTLSLSMPFGYEPIERLTDTCRFDPYDRGHIDKPSSKGYTYIMTNLNFAFAGDWHGDTFWATNTIYGLGKKGVKTIYHLGDFGVWPKGGAYIAKVCEALRKNDMEMFVTLGNHEDYNQIKKMKADENGLLHFDSPEFSRLHFFPRGHVWEDSGYRFGSLGGAGSADRLLRRENISWWREERITSEDCDKLISNVADMGWDRVDILLTHEAPAGISLRGFSPLPSWFTIEVQHDCWKQRMDLREAMDFVSPKINVHGHWHYKHVTPYDGVTPNGYDYTCTVIGLANEGSSDNFWVPTKEELELLVPVSLDGAGSN